MTAVVRPSLLSELERRFRLVTFVTTMVPTMGALGLQFVTFALTARGLGIEQFGRYTAVLAIVGIAVELVGLGGGDLVVRAVARDRASFGRYFAKMLFLIALTLPLVIGGGLLLALGPMQLDMSPLSLALALLAEVLVARISTSLELVMVAHGDTARAGWLRVSVVCVRLALAFGFFFVADLHDLDEWILAVLAQSLAATAICIAVGIRCYGGPRWERLGEEAGSGAAFCVNQTARASQSNMDRVVLARFADEAALGAYGAASRILQLGLFPIQVVTRILYPKFFQKGAQGIGASLAFAVKTAPALALVGAVSGAGVALAAMLAPTVLGKVFAGATDTAGRLAIAMPFIALQYPAADALTGAGMQSLRAVIYGVSAVGFGFLMVFGARLGGIDGLVWAFIAGHGAVAVALWLTAFVQWRRRR
ncbi:lipopolysaccharide biosynthesis protein [Derxia lacustris]|uniref:lipopolysaccharide biosynthesis protein n=1 Tax=Derxia lacustris TaxID=764842 RepID=UPI000A171778|nr:lipopolysaccharide biosynthesis protein [Derxia lacustris]